MLTEFSNIINTAHIRRYPKWVVCLWIQETFNSKIPNTMFAFEKFSGHDNPKFKNKRNKVYLSVPYTGESSHFVKKCHADDFLKLVLWYLEVVFKKNPGT